ncbi:hypothetical protein [Rhizobium jaguaris]|nr:hypothetical protein [Rhizobium jaguaris]
MVENQRELEVPDGFRRGYRDGGDVISSLRISAEAMERDVPKRGWSRSA